MGIPVFSLLLGVWAVLAIAGTATADFIHLGWEPSVGGNRAFYRVYLGDQPGVYRAVLETPWEQAKLTGLTGGKTYYVTVRSVNSVGLESVGSPEIRVNLPQSPFAVSVTAFSEQRAPWRDLDLIAPATLKIKAVVGVRPSEVDRIEIGVVYTKPDGSKENLRLVLKEPPYETEIAGIGGASGFSFNPILVLKNGKSFNGNFNDGEGLPVRVHPRIPKHQLRVTSGQSPLLVSSPVTLGVQLDDIGMPVRRVVFMNGTVVIGEDATPPYSIEWRNSVEGNVNLKAHVFYHGLEQHLFAPSNDVGLHYSKPPATLGVSASHLSAGKILLRGEMANYEGFQVAKVQFLDGDTVVGEDADPPYEVVMPTTAGTDHKVSGRVVFSTGHELRSQPLLVNPSGNRPLPTVALRVPSPSGVWFAPAKIEIEAVVAANGNTIQKVQFLEDGNVLGEDATSPYTLSWSNVTAGTRSLVARVFHGSNQTVDSAVANVVVVNPLPGVVVSTGTAPAGGWLAPAMIPLSAVVAANGNTIQKVQFLEDGNVLGEDATAPYTLSWSNVTAGTWSVVARVFHGSNQTVDSAVANVVVMNPVPGVVVSTGTAPAGGWLAPAMIPLNAVVTAQGNAIRKVQFLADGNVLGEDATAPYTLSWSNVTAGTRSVVARVFYGLNQTVDSAVASVMVVNPVPGVVVSTGTAPAGGWLAPATLEVVAVVTAQGNAIRKVQFLADGKALGEDATAPYTLKWSNVTAGTRSVVARVFYGSNQTVDSAVASVVVVNPAPRVVVSVGRAPAGGWLAPAMIPLSALVTEQGNTIQKVQFLEDGNVIGEDLRSPYTLSWSGVMAGTRSVVARVFYASNQMVESAATNVVVVNPAPRVVVSAGKAPVGEWLAPATIPLNAVVTEQGNTVHKVEFLEDGKVIGEIVTAPYTLSWSSVMAGTRNVVARVFYGADQTVDSGAAKVVVLNPPPGVELNSGTAPAGGWLAPATIPLSAVVTANGNAIQRVQFLGDRKLIGEAATAPYTLSWSNVTAGTRSVVARVVYGANQTADSGAAKVVVVNPAPGVVLGTGTAPAGGWRAPATVEVVAVVTAQGNVIRKVQFLADGKALGEDATAPYTLKWSNVTAGTRSVVARVFYGSSQSVDSQAVSITVVETFPDALTKGLVAYYPLNGNADDASGSGRHGVVQGTTLAADRFGKRDAAYFFNGATPISGKPSRITTPQTASFTNGFTASVWIAGSTNLQPESYILGSGRDESRWIGLRADRRPTTSLGKLVLQAEGLTTAGARLTPAQPSSPAPMEFSADGDRWYHVVLAIGGDRMSVYVDGKLSGSTVVGALGSLVTGRIVIGDFEDAVTGNCWSGCIDDVRIYNRALSASDVALLYGYESRISVPMLGRVGSERMPLSHSDLPPPENAGRSDLPSSPDSGSGDTLADNVSAVPPDRKPSEDGLPRLILRASGTSIPGLLMFSILAPQGVDVVIETATNLWEWTPSMRIEGGGNENPVLVQIPVDPEVRSRFWRVKAP